MKTNWEGKRFGKLIILKRIQGSGNDAIVSVLCDCGVKTIKKLYIITSGHCSSCGCIKFTAGKESYTNPLYKIFRGAKERCENKKGKDYIRYGARGIRVEWPSFIEFKKDLQKSYLKHKKQNKTTTLDRIDVNGNYSKKNCRWVTTQEQASNRRNNKFIIVCGVKKTYAQWAKQIGCSRQALRYRIINGLDPQKAITVAFKHSNKYATL